MALETPKVEALSSLVAALADIHCISVNDLISVELVKLMRPALHDLETSAEPESDTKRKLRFSKWISINSASDLAFEVVSALQSATGVKGLEYLTMIPLSGYLVPTMANEKRKWCAMCLNEFREAGRAFEPLVWSLETVSCCPEHRALLEERCPECLRSSVALQGFSRPGFCPWCYAWLGLDSVESSGGLASDCPIVRAAVLTGELVADLPRICAFQGENTVQRNLKRLIERSVYGNQSAFFREYGSPEQRKMLNKRLPTLKMLVSLSTQLELPLATFFNPDSEACDAIWRAAVDRMDETVRKSVKTQSKTIQFLRDSLSVWPPPSPNTIAQELGYRSTIPLYRADRSLTAEVRMRYEEYSRTSAIHTQRRPTFEAIRRELENALLDDVPGSVAEIGKGLGFFNSIGNLHSHSELCGAITRKRERQKEAELKRQKEILRAALDEYPAPSLDELRERLGLKCFTSITDRFPEISAALVQRRTDQHSARIASIRDIIEEQLRRPNLRWKEVLEATGLKRSSIERYYPDLVPIIKSKNKETLEAQRVGFSDIARTNVGLVVKQLLSRGVDPSINLVWNAIPRLPHHGKTMVERILRTIRTEEAGSLDHDSIIASAG
jgi:hypothetical protein